MKRLTEQGSASEITQRMVDLETESMTAALTQVAQDQLDEETQFRSRFPRNRMVVMARRVRVRNGSLIHDRQSRHTR